MTERTRSQDPLKGNASALKRRLKKLGIEVDKIRFEDGLAFFHLHFLHAIQFVRTLAPERVRYSKCLCRADSCQCDVRCRCGLDAICYCRECAGSARQADWRFGVNADDDGISCMTLDELAIDIVIWMPANDAISILNTIERHKEPADLARAWQRQRRADAQAGTNVALFGPRT